MLLKSVLALLVSTAAFGQGVWESPRFPALSVRSIRAHLWLLPPITPKVGAGAQLIPQEGRSVFGSVGDKDDPNAVKPQVINLLALTSWPDHVYTLTLFPDIPTPVYWSFKPQPLWSLWWMRDTKYTVCPIGSKSMACNVLQDGDPYTDKENLGGDL